MKSLLWILLWGGLFFLMMRYGCGAHMMGGHGHGGGHGNPGPGTGSENKDPVCGMTVNSQNAAAASVHGGRTYYFCSTSCRDQFEQAPDKYIGASAPAKDQQGGHHHG
ncbi:MAG: YHS domain-containing protein [Betaproteobacteria bacterium]|nr:YHS domain-containing protein [Betaproteobacteria bacterium]